MNFRLATLIAIVRPKSRLLRNDRGSPNGNLEYPVQSLRLYAGRPDHPGPFLGFVGDEFPKFIRRACKRHAADVGNPRLDR